MALSNPKSFVLTDYDNLDIDDTDFIAPMDLDMDSKFWSSDNNVQQSSALMMYGSDLLLTDQDLGYSFGSGPPVLSSMLDPSLDQHESPHEWTFGPSDYGGGSTLSEMDQLVKDVSTAPSMPAMPGTYEALGAYSTDAAASILVPGPEAPLFSVKEESELKRQLLQKKKVTRSAAASPNPESSNEKPASIRKRLSDELKVQPRSLSSSGKKMNMSTELKKQLETAPVKAPGKLNEKIWGSTNNNRPQARKNGGRLPKNPKLKLSSLPDALQGMGADAKKSPYDNSLRRITARPGKKEPRRTAQMIDPLPRPPPPAKVAKTAAAKINKQPPPPPPLPAALIESKKSASVELSPLSLLTELPVIIGDNKLLDHDYCSPKPKRKVSTESGKSLREVAIKRSGSRKSSRSISTAEYLRLNKEGIRSAPVTPHQSPKPTRGSKRCSNNYMIETKSVNDEISQLKLSQVVSAYQSKVKEIVNPPVVAMPEPLAVKNILKPDPNLQSLSNYIQRVCDNKSGSSHEVNMFCTIKEEANGKVHTVAVKQQSNNYFDPRLNKPKKLENSLSLPCSPIVSSKSPSTFEDKSLDHQLKIVSRTPMIPSPVSRDSLQRFSVVPSDGNGGADRSRYVQVAMNDPHKIYNLKNMKVNVSKTSNPSIMTRPNTAQVLNQNPFRNLSICATARKHPIVPTQLTLMNEIQKQNLKSQIGTTAASAASLAPGSKKPRVVSVLPTNARKINGSSYQIVRPSNTTNQTLQIVFPTTPGAQGNLKTAAQAIHPSPPNGRRMLRVLTSRNTTRNTTSPYITSPQMNGGSLKLVRNVSSPVSTTTTVPPGVRVVTLPVSASGQQIINSPSSTTSIQPMMRQIRRTPVITGNNSTTGNRVLFTNPSGALKQALTSSSVSPVNLNHLSNSIELSSLMEPKTEIHSDQDADQYFSHGRTPSSGQTPSSTSASRQLSPLLNNEDVFITQDPIRKPRPMKFNIKQTSLLRQEEPLDTTLVMRNNNEFPDASALDYGYLKKKLEEIEKEDTMERGRTTMKRRPGLSNVSASTSARSSRQVSRSSSRDTSSGDDTSSVPSSRDSSSDRSPARFQRASPTYSSYDGQSPSPSRSPRVRHRASFRNYRANRRQSNNLSGENEFGGTARRGFKRAYGGDDRERELIKRRRREEEAKVKGMEREALNERRVMFVGGLLNDTTEDQLYERFSKFGKIVHIKMKRRNQRNGHLSDYAFVYYETKEGANRAIEEGNDGEEVEFQLSFGGRREFCKSEYADLDNVRDDEPVLRITEQDDQDLQELLRQHQQEQERNL